MIVFHDATLVLGGRTVIDGLSLEVPAGHAMALIGRTGAGKTTLLAAAATAVRLERGEVALHGHSVRREPAAVRGLVGYMPARPPAWPPCRVGEFLEVAAAAAGLQGKPRRSAVSKSLELAGLGDRADDAVEILPDGVARRLLLARALLHDPEVLLLDDPFAALDPEERRTVEALVTDAQLMGRTVLAAIDDADVPPCFTHVAVIDAGRLAASGPADPVTFAPGRRLTFRLACPGRAGDAARALQPLVGGSRAVDVDHAEADIDPARTPGSSLVAAVVAAGIPVAAAGFHPAWTAQLLP